MLKHLKFSGVFHDENMSVHVTLENPLDSGLDAAALVFSVTIKDRNIKNTILQLQDFTFYVMDEAGCMHNTQHMQISEITKTPDNDEPEHQADGLIVTEFKHEFLYQDQRVAFDFKPYQRICIIELNH